MRPSAADSVSSQQFSPPRPIWRALAHGTLGRCPSCGHGQLFSGYLEIADNCSACGEELYHHHADRTPPYLTFFLVAHLLVPLAVILELLVHPAPIVHLLLWLPLTLLATLLMLPRVKGAILGLQWALRMHGFEYASLAPRRR